MATKLWKALIRRRIEENDEGKGELARVLGLFDLTALGVGATLGLGVYVLAGSVARETAGPAVCISFLIAAFASALAGMCYAEFASRVPKAGSAYVYSYVTVGEFIAFVIGWNLILEYVIGTASVARGLSNYVDSLIDNKMRDFFKSIMPINVSFLSDYPDFFAFLVVMLLVLLLCIGVQESSYLNMCFTAVNLVTILIVIVAGSIKADPANWKIPVESIPPEVKNAGVGGFMPFGISGVMFGAAKCFYGFVGFDAVAATGEEAKNPQKNIPLAIVISLSIIFAAYFSISTVLTMMWPYYDQNTEAPFPYVFQQIGWPVIMWIVNVGAVFALCTSLLGAMFPLPRILYAMASDGVIFKFLAKIHNRTQTPILGTIISGLLIGLMTLMFNLEQLIDMMSIGTLLAYTIVAISVLILRYQKTSPNVKMFSNMPMENHPTYTDYFKRVFNICNEKVATSFSSRVASWGVLVFSILAFIFGLTIKFVQFDNNPSDIFAYFVLTLIGLMIVSTMFAIGRQPVDSVALAFKVPLVPLVPCASIFINLFLMLQLDIFTWIRFVVWMIIGFCIYFFYGIRNSSQGQRDRLLNNRTTIHDYTNPIKAFVISSLSFLLEILVTTAITVVFFMMFTELWKALTRKRIIRDLEDKGKLARVLGLFDLSALGVGATLGLGVYVLAGSVAKDTAGPAVCVSFLIAAIASALAGMCYAEFASRVPKAGSAYVYSYVTIGEFIAFIIGWNLILEYVIATASVARGLSSYVDSLVDNKMRTYFHSVMPIEVSFLSEYPDFFAFGVIVLLVALLCIGAQESSYLNMGFTAINLTTVLVVTIAGSIKANPANWQIAKETIPPEITNPGVGGFMPFGLSGIMIGAAKCFYGFVGFDAVAATGEEAKDPQKTIPLAIVISLTIIFVAYFSTSTVLTMMWPYYDQNPEAPLPYVFQKMGWPALMWIVNIGAVSALCTNLLGSMFPLPRILYAMGSDGVIFKFFSKVHSKTRTPIIGTIVSGAFIGLMTLMFNLEQLIDMMSIGTLLAYTIVAISVLILRYQTTSQKSIKASANHSSSSLETHSSLLEYSKTIFNFNNRDTPSESSSKVASWGILVFAIMAFIFGLSINRLPSSSFSINILVYLVLLISGMIGVLTVFAISRQPINSVKLAFKVPLVPFAPCCSIFINLFLMLQLDMFTWIRFSVWMVIGLCIYFFYGIKHSVQGQKNQLKFSNVPSQETQSTSQNFF